MKRKIFVLFLTMILMASLLMVISYGSEDLEDIKNKMDGVGEYDTGDVQGTGIGKIINSGIGIIQYAGSGIAIIVVSILGIKYLLSSPTEKADIKKMAIPIVIGCVLLFGAVNLASIIYNFTTGAFGD